MTDISRPANETSGADLTGRTLGDYRLLRRLGKGAMADVYLAEQSSLRRQVAFKVLKSDLATDATYVKRFHMEAQAAASFVHANVVQIHEVGCLDGVHFIAQEYVQGQNLREMLARSGPPDLRRAMTILRQTAAALHQAAERGIVHRDIKPENIMLSRTGEVKVADFGLARLTRDAGVNLTQVGITMGTPLYMSPEQVAGKPLDPRSDIYSLGVTAFHMLAGEPPFAGDTALAVAVQHLNVPPPRLENIRPDLPPALCRIVHKMLAKTAEERHRTARDLLRDLRAVRVPGLDDDPDREPGEGSTGGQAVDEAEPWADAEVTARLDATRKLDALMKTSSLEVPRRQWLWPAAAVVAAFIVGGALAWATREPYLLAGADAEGAHVQRLGTAQLQLDSARNMKTEQAYEAVLTYFPKDEYAGRLAEQELAMLYLRRNDYPAARALFDKFANLPEVDQQFRAFGLAGQAVVYFLEKDQQAAALKLGELLPIIRQLDHPQMLQAVGTVYQQNPQAQSQQDAAEWKEWLSENLEDEG